MHIFAHLDDAAGASSGGLKRLWDLMGAFHPLVVHFPIALLLTAAVLEFFSLWNGNLRYAITVNLFLGAVAAVVAAPLGWIDANQMHFEPDLQPVLTWHRWLGTSVALGALLALVLFLRFTKTEEMKRLWTYRVVLWLVALALAITGHMGGLLVYGLDYFSP